jgi:FlaA1/EpsC-like NDP-sugar epimerase
MLTTIAYNVRGRHLVVLDTIGIVIATYLALAFRYSSFPVFDEALKWAAIVPVLLAVRITSNVWLGLYSRSWRHASIPDLVRITTSVLIGSTVAVILFYGSGWVLGQDWLPGFPRSFWIAEALVSTSMLGGARLVIRMASDFSVGRPILALRGRPTLVYGAGRTGTLIARSAIRNPGAGVNPVGFLDDDPTLEGGVIAGLRVFGGLDALPDAVAATGATSLLVTMPSAAGSAVRRVVEAAADLELEVRTVPAVTDLLDGSLDAHRVRRIRVEDLLRRPMVTEHAVDVGAILRDKTVLITGAGGSIGSELARQVFAIGPRRLILVDRAETPLYLMQLELESKRRRGRGQGELRIHLGNVTSRLAVRRLILSERPDVIFHAAAYKHVPMMEEHPSDAVYVNISGTRAMLDAAAAAGVERFVFVSTDKAVHPSSAMGASKRVAEMLVAQAAQRTGRPYVSVRFGNVLGSNGSVVPIFQDQLENGQPITITDMRMTRFFMTIPEAAWLILDAATLGAGGDLFVLDMGEPVRILDLARDLIRLSGRDPESHPIIEVGLRPGEKLHEELFYDREHAQETAAPKVLRVATAPPPTSLDDDIRNLIAMATGDDEGTLRDALIDYARSLESPETTRPVAEISLRIVELPQRLLEAGEAAAAGTDASSPMLEVLRRAQS